MESTLIEAHLPCSTCGSTDALSRYTDHTYCFSCKTRSWTGVEKDPGEIYTYEYLPWRGITKHTMQFFDCLTKIDSEGKPIILGFKYPNGSVKFRDLSEKRFYSKGDQSEAGLFGQDKFSAGSHRYVTITEGELDALSLYQVLGGPTVSVRSSSSAVRDCSAARSWLNSHERIYLAFDADGPGQDAAAAVARLFDFNKVYLVKFTKWKDANEYLENGEGEELRKIWWNSRRFIPEGIISSFSEFEKILKDPTKVGVPYPFPTLTGMTYGIRRGESVLVTAQEGVGKTEFMHSLEYHLLKETNDNVGAIYLEEGKQRHLQAIAGQYLKAPCHIPDGGIDSDEAYRALVATVGRDDRLHLYSHFGSDDPEILLDRIRFLVTACSCFYILLDHLTMCVSGSGVEDERRTLDYLATHLETMVKDLQFALILVSHVNDNGQTRGSRYISKIADIRIDLSRDYLNVDPLIRNTTIFTVSKNRFCGKTGYAGKAVFDPVSYTLSEFIAANDNDEVKGDEKLLVRA